MAAETQKPDSEPLEEKARREYERQHPGAVPWERLTPAMRAIWSAYVRNGNYLPPR
jgi:hypothetical protein